MLVICGCTGVEAVYSSMQAGPKEEPPQAVSSFEKNGTAQHADKPSAPGNVVNAEHSQVNKDSREKTDPPAQQGKANEGAAVNTVNAPQTNAVQADSGKGGQVSAEQPGTNTDKASSADNKNVKRVALTFDDGPDSKYTPAILDILKKQNVKATFFIVGKQAEAHPDMLKRIVSEGHVIGNHSWNHRQMNKLNAADIDADLKKTDELLQSITGIAPTLFRAPYGAVSSTLTAETAKNNLKLVGWTSDTRDWDGSKPDEMMNTVHRQLKPGGIVLMHCFGGKGGDLSNTVAFLPNLIADLEKQGYTLVTVPELLEAGK